MTVAIIGSISVAPVAALALAVVPHQTCRLAVNIRPADTADTSATDAW
jgi:hypothetical protein